ncbi:hypothetical protein MLD38_008199 [Melastoma candidum]|uniref:Uncharacterized protein n=1 Tax=Melastoma candidum TaxID=119954 RepID=A0ACB9RX97_9MYRT|nr:hypothetical protein MLD38_008199 [Melastoma candidum]
MVGLFSGTARPGLLFAYTSDNRSDLCEPQTSSMNYLKNEHICGRPLGLRFDKRTGDLYIADAYYGIMKVGPEGGLATSITTEAEGVPFRFTNDLDIDDDGNIYFNRQQHQIPEKELLAFGLFLGKIVEEC